MTGNWITCEKCSKPVDFMMHVWSPQFMDVVFRVGCHGASEIIPPHDAYEHGLAFRASASRN